MALWSPRLQRFLLNNTSNTNLSKIDFKKTNTNFITRNRRRCSAIAIDAPSYGLASGIRWGSAKLQGARDEMEVDAVIVANNTDDLQGFYFAAVFYGHAGFSSFNFLREKLYKECVKALQGGQLLDNKDFIGIKNALQEAFHNADAKEEIGGS
ncbi:putative protein-serine/threonine phosphatase [Helianthus annuus]|uniref:Uncharacterized protein n=1 Tax=Helianthus annuus TaxID=4232 RepID=A0A9K3JPU7_HELAN|nr:protein phosphatase 2C 57-like [Helianthus annuus]KAF5819581.1 putative protein-serine/threonine phosphatase [Helianthus annuus]KAJ0605725.1 putative protein-serine/threonine phosphatase [Helianthus annuus]KAJ0616608.1 putative protein-serine/threonine phosphatase [Helianthus annuus]KAJ0619741.1 putative protein-serine/threonine phosphatase [Helianthus annuus]KAJ0778194.1 putative protein-serine/threonine phosphatase [Helianthus annuus]